MRVLYLTEETISFNDPLVRGGAIHVRNVVEGLRDRGVETTLIDWNKTPERSYQCSVDPPSRFVAGAVWTTRRATQVGRRRDIDIVVSKTRKTYIPGLVTSRRLGVPHVVHVGSSLDRPTAGMGDRISMTSFKTRLSLPHDGYFVVCEHIADQLRARGIDSTRIFNLQNAVDTKRFHPTNVPKPIEERFRKQIAGIDDDQLRLGYVGGLQPYKGLADLATALEHTANDLQVIVAGDGPERERLEKRFGAVGTFVGSVPYDQIPAIYHEFDVFVLPSHTEGLPRVVLEAQATATPVVATRVGGVPEVVKDGETGCLVDPGQPVALAEALDPLLSDKTKRRRLGDNGRAAIEEEFSWDALYDRYVRYLKETDE